MLVHNYRELKLGTIKTHPLVCPKVSSAPIKWQLYGNCIRCRKGYKRGGGGDIVQLPKMFRICVNYLIKRLNFGRIGDGDGDEAPTLELKLELREVSKGQPGM